MPTKINQEVTQTIQEIEAEINKYKTSEAFERNFILKAAEWKLQQTLGNVRDEEQRGQLLMNFYMLIKGCIEPEEFYEKLMLR